MRRPAVLVACLAAAVALGACGSPKSSSSSPSSTSLPGSPQAAGGGAPAPGPTAGPASTLPSQCGLSDAWGIAYLKATQEPVAAAQQAEVTTTLDEKAAAFSTAVPELSSAIAARTELAKKIMAGTATDADREAEVAARDTMNAWYGGACSTTK